VCETVLHFRGKEDITDPRLRGMAASVPYLASLSAITWRGHNPTMFKVQQDRMIVAIESKTSSLLVAVFDGHGQNGHKVCVCGGDGGGGV
jgi:hypothetical protein